MSAAGNPHPSGWGRSQGRPRATRWPVQLTPKPARCVCGADTLTETCPQNCPTREDAQR